MLIYYFMEKGVLTSSFVTLRATHYKLESFKFAEAKPVFDEFDNDGDGYIDASELGTALKRMGLNPSLQKIQSMIGEVDKDGNILSVYIQ